MLTGARPQTVCLIAPQSPAPRSKDITGQRISAFGKRKNNFLIQNTTNLKRPPSKKDGMHCSSGESLRLVLASHRLRVVSFTVVHIFWLPEVICAVTMTVHTPLTAVDSGSVVLQQTQDQGSRTSPVCCLELRIELQHKAHLSFMHTNTETTSQDSSLPKCVFT